jgi:hypothetical protein
MSNTVRMIRTDDGKTGDIHPDEVEHMIKHGWQVVDVPPMKTGDKFTLNGEELTVKATSKDSLDHDKDGKPGGSEPQGEVSADLEKLREDAKALGLKVHWKHSAETIQAAIDAKLAE